MGASGKSPSGVRQLGSAQSNNAAREGFILYLIQVSQIAELGISAVSSSQHT